MQASHFL
jgi:hypothetical protein